MGVKFEITILCIGGIIRISDLAMDITYYLTQDFMSDAT